MEKGDAAGVDEGHVSEVQGESIAVMALRFRVGRPEFLDPPSGHLALEDEGASTGGIGMRGDLQHRFVAPHKGKRCTHADGPMRRARARRLSASCQ